MGQHTLLRTLTRKSLLKFGIYADYTVDQLLQLKIHSYLRWVYYNCSNISFNIEVLELLHIDQMQIDKPGKDERTGDAVQSFMNQFIPFKIKSHNKSHNKKEAKAKLAGLMKKNYNRKDSLMYKNHGH